jgi:hypothetical protein
MKKQIEVGKNSNAQNDYVGIFCSFFCLLTTVFLILKPGEVSCCVNERKKAIRLNVAEKSRKKRKGTDYRNRNSDFYINNKNSFTFLDFDQATTRTQHERAKIEINCSKING